MRNQPFRSRVGGTLVPFVSQKPCMRRPSRRVTTACQSPPPHRYCHAIPSRSKLLPVRADTPLLA